LPPFEEYQAAAAARAAEKLQREIKWREYRESLRVSHDPSEYVDPLDDDDDADPSLVGGVSDADSGSPAEAVSDAAGILSPKIDFATEFPSPTDWSLQRPVSPSEPTPPQQTASPLQRTREAR